MSLTSQEISDISQYLYIANNIVSILDKETSIGSDLRIPNGVSNDNITNLNNTLTDTLSAIDSIITSPAPSAPTITLFTPTHDVEGALISIAGTNLTGATVTFNSTPAIVVSNTDTLITCTVPTGALTGVITVTTSGGTTFSSTVFTVNYPL